MASGSFQRSDRTAILPVDTAAALQRFVAALPVPLVVLDEQWTVRAGTAAWARQFGGGEAAVWAAVPEEARDGRAQNGDGDPSCGLDPRPNFFELFADRDGTWRDLFRACRDEQAADQGGPRPLCRPGGATYWVEWTVRPWQTEDGTERGVLLGLTDRTREHRTEALCRRVERRFDVLIDTISEGVLLMDDEGRFRDCNEAAEAILGRPAEEIVGTQFHDDRWSGLREDGSPLPNVEFPVWRAYVEREPIEEEVMGIYPPEAPPRWIRVNAQPLFHSEAEAPYAVLACFEDVTDERLKEEALQTSRDLLSSVLGSSLDGIVVFGALRGDGGQIEGFECLLANPQAEKLLQQSSRALLGSRLRDVLPEHDDVDLHEACRSVVETGDPFETEVHYDADSMDAWIHVMIVRIDGGVAVTLRDISERKQAVQAIAAANAKLERRNRALRDFAYIASHDLQEPLRKIRSFSGLVLEEYGDAVDEAGTQYLERIEDASERMSQLINDLLVYSRVTTRAQPFEPVDLGEVARTVRGDLELQIEDVGGTVEIGDLPTIKADPTQMRQVLQNLIGNALKFHKPDAPPHVRVDATVEPAPDSLKQDGRLDAQCTELCRLTVTDNGIGFEAHHEDQIFTPFKRLHGRSDYEGTGMGLAICRRIVERHGGDISASSTPGEGTTVTVRLPVDRADGAEAGPSDD